MPESIIVICAGCAQHLRVSVDRIGETGRCPRCQTSFTVPAAAGRPGATRGGAPLSRRGFWRTAAGRAAGLALAGGLLGGGAWWYVAGRRGPQNPGTCASLDGRRVFPETDPWNQAVLRLPVDPNSDQFVEGIGADKGLHPDFGTDWRGRSSGIPYVVVPGTQPKVPVQFEDPDESDPGPYPIPADAPVEGGRASNGDRHVLVVDRDAWKLYELYKAYPDGGRWRAGSGAVFDLNTSAPRPAGWTSADAAGLPIFPGLVRYDEVRAGLIPHALRFTCKLTRRAYVPPARHCASSHRDPGLPPLGMRVRLKASFDTSGFPPAAQVILLALQMYGMFLADNGLDWALTGTDDPRWPHREIQTLKRVKGRDFEVVRMEGLVAG